MPQDIAFVIKSIRSLDQFFEKCIQQKVEQSGVTLPQMRVIQEVIHHPGLSIDELSKNLQVTQSTVSGIVQRLIHKGYLMKKTNVKDKRMAEIWCTNDVAEFIENNSTAFVNEAVGHIFSQFGPNDLEIVSKGLQLLLSEIKAQNNHCQ